MKMDLGFFDRNEGVKRILAQRLLFPCHVRAEKKHSREAARSHSLLGQRKGRRPLHCESHIHTAIEVAQMASNGFDGDAVVIAVQHPGNCVKMALNMREDLAV